jgi:chitodextrinase
MARSHRLLLPSVLALAICVQAVAPAAASAAPAAPARAAAPAPAAPIDLRSTASNSSVSLTWEQPAIGPRPDHFRVYEGDTVVARNTTTHVTVTGLGFLTTHTFRVTAVAADGTESPASAPITRGVYIPGMNPACVPIPPAQVQAQDLSSSAVSLTWARTDPPRQYRVVGAGQDISTSTPQVRFGGLAPAQTYTFSVFGYDCRGAVQVGAITVTTPAGPTEWPGQPTDVTTGARTDSSATLTWSAPVGGTQVRSYALYRGATRILTTRERTARLTGLWRGTEFPITVAAIGHDGAESVHSAPLAVRPSACDGTPPAPEALTTTAVSASSVELRWLTRTEAISFTVLDGTRTVTTVQVPSARITGLASGSTHRFRVVANLTDGCGASPASRRVKVSTPAGPGGRLGAPTGLQPVVLPPMSGGPFGTVAMQWQAPVGATPASYRIYEGATLFGSTSTATSFSTVVPAATSHLVTVVAVDGAGNESVPSNAITVTGFHLPLP